MSTELQDVSRDIFEDTEKLDLNPFIYDNYVPQMARSSPVPTPELSVQLSAGIQEFRGALTELLGETQISTLRPLPLARALGVDKNLAWKVSKILSASTPNEVFKHLPGNSGLEIILAAAIKRGGQPSTISRTKKAIRSISQLVEHHLGDRSTLELVLDAMSDSDTDRLLLSRKLAFRGNSGIWGMQAATRINTAIVAPSRTHPGLIDQATIGGWVDFRRLRPDAEWALFRRIVKSRNSSSSEEPIDLSQSPDGPMLIPAFCSKTLPPIQVVKEPSGIVVYELDSSPVGNTGAFTCFFGSIIRNIGSRYATAGENSAWFGGVISAPVEMMIFDVLVHRELSFISNLTPTLYGNMAINETFPSQRERLPLKIDRIDLGSPPIADTPHVRNYNDLITHSIERCNWNMADFRGYRFMLQFPPFPSRLVLSFPLEKSRE